jgi:serine/threonine-protein kinase
VIGQTIGNFKVVSRLGVGGMGEVWLAEQQNIGTHVAIKLLNASVSQDTEHVQRFFNEARAVSRIQHAGIVKIFDVGTHAGQAYLIMEYLEGETLSQRLAKLGRLPFSQIGDIGRQIATVLDATHTAGITHRDLKPDNIFLVPDRELGERVKVLDFGIAKLTGTLAGHSPRTMGTMGTPAYMAPEQWGDTSKVDWRADLYSLGCVAFEMTCGRE